MKAISLHRPWAQWVALGLKTVETRTHDRFKGLVGQRIAIHAAQKWDYDWKIKVADYGKLDLFPGFEGDPIWRPGLLCMVFVSDGKQIPAEPFYHVMDVNRLALCDIRGRYCLLLNDLKVLEKPIPWKGGRGIFNVPDEVLKNANNL